jgi:hypothetical protein
LQALVLKGKHMKTAVKTACAAASQVAVLLAGGLVGVVAPAQAQTIKPGLWEITQKTNVDGRDMGAQMAQMQAQLEKMPPAQRKMMEEMMAKQGVSMPGTAGGGAMTLKTCLSKEMVEKNQLAPQQGDCTHSQQPRSGNTMKFSFQCKNPPSTGEGEVTFSGSDAYTTKVRVTTQRGGQQHTATMEGSSKWLGADCGSIKPMSSKL